MSLSSVSSSGVDRTLKLIAALPSRLARYAASWEEMSTTHQLLSSRGFLAVDLSSCHPSRPLRPSAVSFLCVVFKHCS